MAATKKTVAPAKGTVSAAKVEESKTELKKTETAAAPAKKPTAKTDTVKKAAVKKTATKKAELKCEFNVQFEGKSYSQEDLVKIAKDVWKYDLKQKVGDLASIELYVKPEENMVYYVMNKEFTGSFYI